MAGNSIDRCPCPYCPSSKNPGSGCSLKDVLENAKPGDRDTGDNIRLFRRCVNLGTLRRKFGRLLRQAGV